MEVGPEVMKALEPALRAAAAATNHRSDSGNYFASRARAASRNVTVVGKELANMGAGERCVVAGRWLLTPK